MIPKAWSYSALNRYTNCPRAYHQITVERNFIDEMGEEALWGDRVHKAIEAHIRDGKPMKQPMFTLGMIDHVKRTIDALPDGGDIVPESKFAISKSLKPCSWMAKDVWFRSIIDLLCIDGSRAVIADWKSGRVRPDSKQLKLFALTIFYHYPDVMECATAYEWLAFNTSTVKVYTREQIPELWLDFLPDLRQYKQSFKEDKWPARTSGLCKAHCIVTTCEHNGRR